MCLCLEWKVCALATVCRCLRRDVTAIVIMTERDFVRPTIGSVPLEGGTWRFVVWAPHREKVELHLLDAQTSFCEMEQNAMG